MTVPSMPAFAPASRSRRETRRHALCGSAALGAFLLTLCVGCQGINPGAGEYQALTSTDGILGPMSRAIRSTLNGDAGAEAATPEMTSELASARRLFDDGKYDAAGKQLQKIAKKHKLTAFGEEAQFLLGECYYRQRRLAYAQDAYDQLLEDYPSTRHVDTVTKRLFTIGRTWLGITTPASADGVQLASFEDGEQPQEPARLNTRDLTVRVPLLPNFHDRSRPVFDTQGRALQALKSIWLNDPTGPLADDALMMTASYYLRKKDNVEADRYYKILREEYPKSPHLENAFLLGSHVKLMSYQGPYYEGNTLEDARKLKESTLRLFPDNTQREQVRGELTDIYREEARRLWARIEYYQKKEKPRAIAIHCRELIDGYPESEFAQRARKILSGLTKEELGDLPGF